MYSIIKKYLPSIQYICFCMKNAALSVGAAMLLKTGIALLPTLQALALGGFIDEMADSFAAGMMTTPLIGNLALLCILIAFTYLLDSLYSYVFVKLKIRVGTAYELHLLEKHSRLTIASLENSKTCQLIEQVTEEGADKMYKGFQNLMDMAEYAIRILGIVAAVCAHSIPIGIFAAFMLLALLPIAKKCGEEDYEAYQKASEQFRRARYFRDVLRGRDYAGEKAVFQYSHWMNDLWEQKFDKGRKFSEKASGQNYFRIKLVSIATLVFLGIVAVTLLFPLRDGRLSAGTYIGIVTLITTFSKMMEWNIAYVVEDFISGRLYILDYFRFMELEECRIEEGENGQKIVGLEEITFRDVSFRYPGTEKLVLNHLNLTLKRGRQYALVGENGAGKTTIVQLLLGLYEDYQGEILLDGRELRTFSPEEHRAYFSCAWQNFVRYEIELGENISPGRKIEESELSALCERLGIGDLPGELPDGFDTELGRLGEKEMDLSGGQWQRIAVARALVRNTPVLILDEPTAALDPSGEQALYQFLQREVRNSIGIWITHRLGGIHGVDEIIVLRGGEVCERGSHAELMEKGGLYAQMFEVQRSWYVETSE